MSTDQIRHNTTIRPCPVCDNPEGWDAEALAAGESKQEVLLCPRGACWEALVCATLMANVISRFALRCERVRRIERYVGDITAVLVPALHATRNGPSSGQVELAEVALTDLMVLALNEGDVRRAADAWRR